MIYVLSQEYEDKMSAKRIERAIGEGIGKGSEITLSNLVRDGLLSPDVAPKYILKGQGTTTRQD